jgi:transcriptional regulator with XRE-family HTH domain
MAKTIYRLKQARIMKGESLRKSADAMGISYEGLRKYEQGLIAMDSTQLIKFANYYGVTVDYLVPNPHRPVITLTDIKFFKLPKYI